MKKNALPLARNLAMLLLSMVWSLPSFSGGFQVNLLGIKQIGMGHLGIGLKLDGSSVYFNSAALSFMPTKYSFSAGLSGIVAKTAFRKSDTGILERSDNPLGTPFYFYGATKLSEKFSVGLGIYTPFGSGVDWGDQWQGRYLIQRISLKTIFFQPTLSFKPHDKISIGAGLIYAYGAVKLNQALPLSNSEGAEGQAELSGTTGGWGVNAGAFFQITEKLSLGLTYKSKIFMKMEDGKADFTVPASLASGFPSGNTFNASIPLPGSINGGVAFQATEKLLVGLDVNFIQWSSYDSLNFDFKNNTAQLRDSKNPRKYKDVMIVRLGGQYAFSDKFTIRAGGYYDLSPVSDEYLNPETPDSDRLGLSAGLSFKPCTQLSIDASFLYINAATRKANYSPKNFEGTYKTVAYVPGIGLTYNF